MKSFDLPRIKLRPLPAVLALLTALSGVGGSLLIRPRTRLPYADTQLAAAQRMARAMESVTEVMRREGITMEPEDINLTGLLGPQWTELTTSLGDVQAKRTSLQPDFAALIVKYYHQAGLQPGQVVAIGMSGSFPGLCLAAVAAANEMDLVPKVIASYGASMFGATRPELAVVRILETARQADALEYEILAVSLGGDSDQGDGNLLFPNARQRMLSIADDDGFSLISETDLAASAKARMALYGDPVHCFVNIGGASVNAGIGADSLRFPNGLVSAPPPIPDTTDRGLIYEYAAQGTPVIHLLNIRGLAEQNGLPYDPSPLPPPGSSGVYEEYRTPPLVPAFSLLICLLLISLARKPASSS